ncbi:MAG: hypothetical protein HZA31_08625 [Opitutae bacterium]|nr:hypothetical protein [Opitutae bacterium]
MKKHISTFIAVAVLLYGQCFAEEPGASANAPAVQDNQEVARLYAEDQSDRQPKDGKPIDWTIVRPRDEAAGSNDTANLSRNTCS